MISPTTMIPALISIHPNAAPSGAGVVHGGLCGYRHKPPYADKDIMPS